MKPIITSVALVFGLCVPAAVFAQQKDYPIQPVNFTQVHVHDHFWQPKMETNARVTIPTTLQKCRDYGRVDNFLMAAGKIPADSMTAYPFDDTDIYKVIEGASYAMQVQKNPQLDQAVDSLINIIGEAQEKDGYLYTFRTAKTKKPHEWIGSKRWEKEEDLSHELYNSGHLFEAASAHYFATKKKTLLNIAIKNADLLVRDFGPGKVEEYPGHQVVEIGLVKLYRITGNKKYLDLAKFFLDVRGPKGDAYNQANHKVVDQHEAEGHAVRATYMYTGMADVAALTGDQKYLAAIDDIWGDVVNKKLYITGGIGATNNGEAFGPAYDLPNMSAYAETCAAIANVYWNNRMFLLHGDAKYIDVLERTLYNGLLSGVSLSGDRFFYPNPLASMGQHSRSSWLNCACCISNMTRFLPSVPGYAYAQNDNDLYVNLFMGSSSDIVLPATKLNIKQETEYPWQGKIGIELNPEKAAAFALHIRIPGWAQEHAVPGDLYRFVDEKERKFTILLNGKPAKFTMEKGYAVLRTTWKKGDRISLDLPMEVQKVAANTSVKDDASRMALQRGPIVYCLEGPDNRDSVVQNIVVAEKTPVKSAYNARLLNGVEELTMQGTASKYDPVTKKLVSNTQDVKAIPYYAWANRGPSEMLVWIPYEKSAARPTPAPSIASTSTVSSSLKNAKSLKAINDRYEPADSKDAHYPYIHWWPAKNTTEYVQYDFDTEHEVSSSNVYWFDDGPWGGCRIPVSYRILYKKGDAWVPVKNTTPYAIAKDRYNNVKFSPVKTAALRLEFKLPADNATGIHEWVVE
ncbi:MAG: glycoside hydrolase family 127 protein [Mucilaginibacter polytrichastri]|nr:glycoside hydrolase family 127 protein [Mucilaginibacter polytrichastri]